ncbi:MAG: cob(I)yrinic acid a,c-diamide adenosyltransferase [Bacteroidota bacterium]|nr:cob(I)yrinic acid a,c-diamide adenosyltransferase [Candidatus Kapabacteria bacterium]MCS7302685.1 cob(I)yrinic acid a,c-diamide adenosyltransferase [Candidatus Kapabacteria bacterium]MCX7936193.1 cob(I)yrinic acid a,c-diamide adenosyltransferase [Chlorobiota bacterium]MDW8074913.1 cob(I)yrinic acid a,c-diamide adenosyltransferase [Bacteroidota bacterium]MDW8271552.1 cob(I)yrinic acid a,c-diamide adenosyltransferase [Bacteroidota bacterium]
MALRIYTKTGDQGTTGLFGGQRVPKYDLRIETYGTVDELNSVLGIVIAHEQTAEDVRAVLLELSSLLFTLGSDLATPLEPPPRYEIPRITALDVAWLEQWIDRWEEELPALKNFILPTGTMPCALLHHARTVCRRAERRAVELAEREQIGEAVVPFLNRCSDFLFVAARIANARAGRDDVVWTRATSS